MPSRTTRRSDLSPTRKPETNKTPVDGVGLPRGVSDSSLLVQKPDASDILCGKDKHCVSHEGSVRFRGIIDKYRDRYNSDSTSKQEKMDITKEIVAILTGEGCRFLKYDFIKAGWRPLSVLASRDKVSHALRFAQLKEHRRTGKAKRIQRRVSATSSSSSSSQRSPSSPSSEDTELWNSLVGRQTKLLESIKKGEKPHLIPEVVELPNSPKEVSTVSPESVPADLDPLSINDSSFERTPAFQDYCLQLYRSTEEENSAECGQNSAVEELPYSVFPADWVKENLIDAFNECDQANPNSLSGFCVDEDHQSEDSDILEMESRESESGELGDEIATIITEPLMAWDIDHDGIFEVE